MNYLIETCLKSASTIFKLTVPRLPSIIKCLNYSRATGSTQLSFGAQNARSILDLDTKVVKDVLLYKYENPRFFITLNVFAMAQFCFWNYLSHLAFTTLRDAPVEKADERAAWYRKINLGENKYKNSLSAICFLIGYGILFAAWMFTLRSVRLLILCKGGQKVSVVSYGPFNRNRIMDVPLKCISAQESRQVAKVHLPVKIKNRRLFYVLDMRGEFLNPKLYDHTIGIRRNLD